MAGDRTAGNGGWLVAAALLGACARTSIAPGEEAGGGGTCCAQEPAGHGGASGGPGTGGSGDEGLCTSLDAEPSDLALWGLAGTTCSWYGPTGAVCARRSYQAAKPTTTSRIAAGWSRSPSICPRARPKAPWEPLLWHGHGWAVGLADGAPVWRLGLRLGEVQPFPSPPRERAFPFGWDGPGPIGEDGQVATLFGDSRSVQVFALAPGESRWSPLGRPLRDVSWVGWQRSGGTWVIAAMVNCTCFLPHRHRVGRRRGRAGPLRNRAAVR